MTSTEKFEDLFTVITVLGEGNFGKVMQVSTKMPIYDLPVGSVIAIKLVKISNNIVNRQAAVYLHHEIEILKTLTRDGRECSEYILCYYGTVRVQYEKRTMPVVLMEYVKGNSLEDYIEHMKTPAVPGGYSLEISDETLLDLMLQLALGLEYMHANNVAHRDIKTANIMYLSDTRKIKYIDFGLSCYTLLERKYSCTMNNVGTPIYLSPEIFKLNKAIAVDMTTEQDAEMMKKSDVWSLGIALYVLVVGIEPYGNITKLTELEAFLDNPSLKFSFPDTVTVDTRILSIILSMLSYDPRMRPTSHELSLQIVAVRAEMDSGTTVPTDASIDINDVMSQLTI